MSYLNAKDAARLIDKGARQNGRDWWVKCPGHDDQRPSLCISSNGSKTLFYCAAGCGQSHILDAIEKKHKVPRQRFFCDSAGSGTYSSTSFKASGSSQAPSDPGGQDGPARPKALYCGGIDGLRPPKDHEIYHHDHLRHTATWNWHDGNGRLLAVTARFEDERGNKDILPFSPWSMPNRGNHIEWQNRAPPLNDLWYDLHLDDTVSPILVVEGEKCVEAAKRLIKRPSPLFFNQVPWMTTVLGGARKLGRMNLSKLAGRHIIIMQDMDKTGLMFAGSFLHSEAASVSLLRIPRLSTKWSNVPNGYDIADMESDGFTIRHLERAAESKIIVMTLR